jgi:hypothetical protein
MTQSEDDGFASGPWTGYYLYSDPRDLHRMELDLRFSDGRISGAGADDVGAFSIRGTYESDSQKVWWRKSYLGAHTVSYAGVLDGGRIYGGWDLKVAGAMPAHGGFKIWPKGRGDGAKASAAQTVETPKEAHVRIRARRKEPPPDSRQG